MWSYVVEENRLPGITTSISTLIGDTFDIIIELTENKPVKVTELSVDACVKHKSKFNVRFFYLSLCAA